MICDFTSRNGLGVAIAPIIGAGGQAAAGVVPAILASSAAASAAAGGSGLILGLTPAIAVPVIGAAIAGVTLAVSLFLQRNAQYFGEETATTQIVNQAAGLMLQNLKAWQSLLPEDKTLVNQQQALANFDGLWNQVVQACSNTAYSHGSDSTGLSPGARCVADRIGSSRGGNGKYDWYAYYRDPITNDTIYQPPIQETLSNLSTDIPSVVTNDISSFFGSIGSGNSGSGVSVMPFLLAGLGIWALSELF